MPFLIGLLSDAHGNGPAFERALDVLLAQGVQELYFLGDAVGYVPSGAVLDAIARLGARIRCIRGNHEEMLLKAVNDGELPDAARERVYQLQALRQALSPSQRDMIEAWPVTRTEEIGGRRLLMVHGSPADPVNGYVYPDTDLSGFAPDADVIFMGHSHYPFIRTERGRLYVNIGSCGLPRDDGRYGSVAVFDTGSGQARVLRFDISAQSSQLLEQFPGVHPSVRQVFERRRDAVFGEML